MTSRQEIATVEHWLSEPLSAAIRSALDRLSRIEDVAKVAVMPDCHLAGDVCNGCVIASRSLIYPDAVGGDIGCGMAAIAFDCGGDLLKNEYSAARVLAGLYEAVPVNRQPHAAGFPETLEATALSHPSLEKLKQRDGRVEFGTLGRGNHFVEFQRDERARLWLMIHSGSRAIGQAIRAHHLRGRSAQPGIIGLPADEPSGIAYLADACWASEYARQSRRAMIDKVVGLMDRLFGVCAMEASYVDCDHNHVRRERHLDQWLWVHRKGANSALVGEAGLIPGSMGTESFHVEGRGNKLALCSSSHGAGRAMSRDQARRAISVECLRRALNGVWFDERKAAALREEAPDAYKDVRAVMRAQRDLVRIVRVLRPVLCYKAG